MSNTGVSVTHAILDAEYFSEKNATELFESGIPFKTKLAQNRTLFKDAAPGNLDDLMSRKYAIIIFWGKDILIRLHQHFSRNALTE